LCAGKIYSLAVGIGLLGKKPYSLLTCCTVNTRTTGGGRPVAKILATRRRADLTGQGFREEIMRRREVWLGEDLQAPGHQLTQLLLLPLRQAAGGELAGGGLR
jgi:hypothetical protein